MSDYENKEFLMRLRESVIKVAERHQTYLTDFLEPHLVIEARKFLEYDNEINYGFFGGPDYSERRRLFLCPDYFQIEIEDYGIAVLEFKVNKVNRPCYHKDFLGALMGLGIKREKIGDIFVKENQAVVLVDKDLSDFIIYNFPKLKGNKFTIEEKHSRDYVFPEPDLEKKEITVASLRLDAMVSKALNISRSEAQEVIKGNKTKVNYLFVDKVNFALKENDLISVRKKGRFIFNRELGETKKGNYKVEVSYFK